jgi:hypothetical protein
MMPTNAENLERLQSMARFNICLMREDGQAVQWAIDQLSQARVLIGEMADHDCDSYCRASGSDCPIPASREWLEKS